MGIPAVADKPLGEVDDWQDDPGDWEDESVSATAPPQPIAPNGPVLRAPERSIWNTIRNMAETSGTVPVGLIPDEGTVRGAVASIAQGPALNWADEEAGLLAQNAGLSRQMRDGLSAETEAAIFDRAEAYAAGGMPFSDAVQRAADDVMGFGGVDYKKGRDAFRDVEGAFRKENPAAAFALQTGSGMLAPTPRGADSGSFLSRYMSAMVPGAVSGAGAAAEAEDMAEAAAVGAPLSAAGQAVGEVAGDVAGAVLGRVGQWAGARVAGAQEKAQSMAADKIAAEVASAKGRLGAVTQEANRALENLLRLESTGGLSGEQAATLATLRQNGTLPALQSKLADAMLEQVPGAAGRVDIARSAFEGLSERAPQASAEAAEDILSGAEAKRQVGERLKRYLPTVLGSMYGAGAGAGASVAMGGGPGEAVIGALAGAGIRPALRAGQRMMAHPAVQSRVFSPVANASGAASSLMSDALPRLGPAATYAWRNGQEAPMRGDTTSSDLVQGVLAESPEALGPYAQQLQQAAADGNLPIVHYALQQKDPQYRRMLDQFRGGTQ